MMIGLISSDKYLTLEAIRAANNVAPIANEATYIDLLLSTIVLL